MLKSMIKRETEKNVIYWVWFNSLKIYSQFNYIQYILTTDLAQQKIISASRELVHVNIYFPLLYKARIPLFV